MSAIPCPCSQCIAHEPHFYVSCIAGGPPGPIPTITCVCPGRETDHRPAEEGA